MNNIIDTTDMTKGTNYSILYVVQESNSFGTVQSPMKVVASKALALKIKHHLENEPKHKFREDSFTVYKVPFVKK